MSATAAASPYAHILEVVAPGVVDLIDRQRAPDQDWWNTLVIFLPSMTATQEQRDLLLYICSEASKGEPPPTISELTSNTASTKPDIAKLITGLGLFITVAGWLN